MHVLVAAGIIALCVFEQMLPHLENVRESVEKEAYAYKRKPKDGKWRQQKLKVTISIGVAEKNAVHKATDEVIKAADQALYRAKKKGRNCVSRQRFSNSNLLDTGRWQWYSYLALD